MCYKRGVKREFSAGGVVVKRIKGRWHLAAIRPRRDHHVPEIWALPKGRIDEGESGAETAAREVLEETGISGEVVQKLGDVRYVYTQTWGTGRGTRIFKVVSFFLLRATGGRIGDIPEGMEVEVAEARWLPLDESPRLLSYKGEQEMAEKAIGVLGEVV
jgi:8-oxo-dGTP pyrophosphatase MutT (NUDIX family)